MDTNSVMRTSVQQTTPTKRTKPKKKHAPRPVKVVYISNPMKIKTSASEFRALVQELTGQDAESPPDPSRFHSAGGLHPDSDDSSVKNVENDDNHNNSMVPPPLDPGNCEPSSIQRFEPLDDDVFTPQMIDNISALLPASIFYEPPLLNHW